MSGKFYTVIVRSEEKWFFLVYSGKPCEFTLCDFNIANIPSLVPLFDTKERTKTLKTAIKNKKYNLSKEINSYRDAEIKKVKDKIVFCNWLGIIEMV